MNWVAGHGYSDRKAHVVLVHAGFACAGPVTHLTPGATDSDFRAALEALRLADGDVELAAATLKLQLAGVK